MSRRRVPLILVLLLEFTSPAGAYIDVTPTLGRLIKDSSNIVVWRVEKISLAKQALIFSKIADLKGETSSAPVKHQIKAGFHPREPATILEWAEPGELAVAFHNGKVAEVCIGRYWYECHAGPDGWWIMNCGQAQLSFSYSGTVSKLREHVTSILGGNTAVITAVKFTADDAYWRACKRVIALRDLPQGSQFPIHRFKASLQMPNSIYEMARDPSFVAEPGSAGPEDLPALIDALNDPRWQARADAAQTLAAVGPAASAALPSLRRALADPIPLVQIRAAEALTAIEPASTVPVPFLTALLKSPTPKIRMAAAQVLGSAGVDPAASVHELGAVLTDTDAKVRWAAVDALARFGANAAPAGPALIEALKDSDPRVRTAAVDALGSIGPKAKAAVPSLVSLLEEANTAQRPMIATALYRIDRRKSRVLVPVLIEELKESDTRLRWHALNYLRKMVHEAQDLLPVSLLIDALHDPDFGVRGMAAWVLGEIGPPAVAAVPALTRALEVNDVWVRVASAPALVKILGAKATMTVPALIDGLSDDEEDTREECLRALQRLGPGARDALATLHSRVKKETALRPLCAETIWRISLNAEVPIAVLTALAQNGDREARSRAVRILGDMGPAAKSAAPTLRALLGHDDSEFRETCMESLRKVDAAEWAQAMARQQGDAIPWGRRLILWVLLLILIGVPAIAWSLVKVGKATR